MAVKHRERARSDGFEGEALTMALAILMERIRSLPKEDKNDLYELMQELSHSESEEDLESIVVAMREILDQCPIRVRKMEVDGDFKPGERLKKWIEFVSVKIRKCREQFGMTQEELAAQSGLPQSHISRLENGQHSPSRKTLEKIAQAFGVDVSTFDPSA